MKTNQKRSGCLWKLLRIAGWTLLALAVMLAGLAIHQRLALSRSRAQFPPPGRLVEVDGHRMHLNCQGQGTPIVVIDAGNGSFSLEWTPIQEQLSQAARVCTYDRAGYGWSEPGPQPRHAQQVVDELHSLLANAGETGPYLLVGHSLGGVHVRLFATHYPQEVAGLVLLDTAYPLEIDPEYERQMGASIGFYQVMQLLVRSGLMRLLGPLGGSEAMPATAQKLPVDLQESYLQLLLDPNQYASAISEMQHIPESFEQTSAALSASDTWMELPCLVVSAGQMAGPGSTPFDEQYVPVPADRLASQAELAILSPQGEHQIVADSGHSLHLDAPQQVGALILQMLERIISQ